LIATLRFDEDALDELFAIFDGIEGGVTEIFVVDLVNLSFGFNFALDTRIF
jgi:hypothetical protein